MASNAVRILLAVSVMEILLLSAVTASPDVMREKRSDDADPMQAVVEQLSQQVNSLSAQLTQQVNSLNSELAVLKGRTDTLDRTVAFYAWHNTNPLRALPNSALILNHVATNVGNAYDRDTGVFTAPVAGLYDIQASFMGSDVSNQGYSLASIFLDGQEMARGISDNRHSSNYDHSSIRAIVHANAGAKITLKNVENADGDYYVSITTPYTTFSGFLIKAD